ncbi:hypothetical protein HDE_09991 [Halotydeus destructor]|nr:hypothetical protein HDE_09991 [Halotydeus destructor]
MTSSNVLSYLLPVPKEFVNWDCNSLCLTGPKSSGKTSLLFQAALNILNENSEATVVLISPAKLDGIPCPVHHQPGVKASIGHRFFIHYIYDVEELLKFVAKFHSSRSYPTAFLVDDLQTLLHKAKESAETMIKSAMVTKALAMITDLAGFCAEKSGKKCHVLLACRSNIVDGGDGENEEYNNEARERNVAYSIAGAFVEDFYYIEEAKGLGRQSQYQMTSNDVEVTYYFEEGQLFLDSAKKKTVKSPFS